MVGRARAKFILRVDNKLAIALSKNPVHYYRSKHIDTKYHFIMSCTEEGKALVNHVGTNGQLRYPQKTKALGRGKFVEMRQKLGVVEVNVAHQG